MINNIIKFDLHIHSKASSYKESPGVVDNSTKEKLDILFSKLNENEVTLFSITDHNRFDSELYLEIIHILDTKKEIYPNVKAVLAGIEFDVKLDENMDKCHIIAIFETNNEKDNFLKIESCLEKNKLTDKNDFYNKSDFENILKEIKLSTILIASQRKDISNHNGKNNSLSDSVGNVDKIIKVGYIDALEFQKPKVEGILINSLNKIPLSVSLISGSDCHDWQCYPSHDENNKNVAFFHSKAKMLPTFKGLLMAVTSPETRFNCSKNTNTNIIEGFMLNGKKIPLVNGVNAIIGENGAGKTTLLKLINKKISEPYSKKLVENNVLELCSSTNLEKVKYIGQGQIINDFNKNSLFNNEYFKEIDNSKFVSIYSTYADELKNNIKFSIKRQENIENLAKFSITFKKEMNVNNYYYINISKLNDIKQEGNQNEKPLKDIENLIEKIQKLLTDSYFASYKIKLENLCKELLEIKEEITCQYKDVNFQEIVKNIMTSCIKDYLSKIKEISTAKDKEIAAYEKDKQSLIDLVVDAIGLYRKEIIWPKEPPVLNNGLTKSMKQGFYFNREASYNNVSMVKDFHERMFVKEFTNIEQLHNIKSCGEFIAAVRNCTVKSENIEAEWAKNFDKFISEATKPKSYIMDGGEQKIGNTLGEMSLSYYKFIVQDDCGCDVMIIDQPEDNISNNNISKKLIGYFNDIRDRKQIIFVTHNPLLVVNLDVDNVIFVKNNGGVLTIDNGCLEYEDEQTNVLDIVANNMDGGKETIEKRLKVYGKNH